LGFELVSLLDLVGLIGSARFGLFGLGCSGMFEHGGCSLGLASGLMQL
jgi:hypothetical protein